MLDVNKMCGRGTMCHWEAHGDRNSVKGTEKLKNDWRRGNGQGKHRWQKSGRKQGTRAHGLKMRKNCARAPGAVVSLRPAHRAPGMRAPRNTNQFLMHEKYQMMHMKSDSVGTESGSDCEMDFADMDSYLGVLENARGALLDIPDMPSPPTFYAQQRTQTFTFFNFDQEESMQYFPSEDDMMQSEDFMQRDFKEFCDTVSIVAPCV
ncbi:hypothetical protein E1301_Tti012735 [Triplophysa tibetana]|uniref:Coiled-coil domain-containing glutamate-rich protein 1 n=1 Tax=Triplophysa tibetana TaxID=1572043 RepID=A0A5A9NUK8_9TELE|nr:hypothetical protein E1301_Tti012735 [Triplophysa tibetana]